MFVNSNLSVFHIPPLPCFPVIMDFNAMQRTVLSAYSGLLLGMLLWASSFIMLKLSFRAYDPMFVIFARMFIGTLCFAPFLGRLRKYWPRREDWKWILLMAFFEPCLYFIFEAKALQNTTASSASMIIAMLPLFVALAAKFFLKETLGIRTLIGFIVAIAGAFWLSAADTPSISAPNPPLGNFFEFLAMVSAVGYTISLKRATRNISPLFLTAAQAAIGSVFFLPLVFWPQPVIPSVFDPVSAGAVVYLGVIVTAIAYGLYNFGVSRIPANQAAAFINLIPIFTITMGVVFLNERLNTSQIIASIMVFSGILISQNILNRKSDIAV